MRGLLGRLMQVGAVVGLVAGWIGASLSIGWLFGWLSSLIFPHGTPKWVSYGLELMLTVVWIRLILSSIKSLGMDGGRESFLLSFLRRRRARQVIVSLDRSRIRSEQSVRLMEAALELEASALTEFVTGQLKRLPQQQPAQYVNISLAEDMGQKQRSLLVHEGIYTNVEYVLGVHIGISPDARFIGPKQRGLAPPDEESISLDVIVVLADGLEVIRRAWDTISWAPVGESSGATFRIKALTSAGGNARLKVIIFHEFELIFCSDIHFDVLSEGDEWPAEKLGVRWKELPAEKARGLSIFRRFEDLNRQQKRSLNISIHRRSDAIYDLLFCLRNHDRQSVLPVAVTLSHEELASFLTRSRSAYRGLVQDRNFKIEAPVVTFLSEKPIQAKFDALKNQAVQTLLESMTILGRDLWHALFGTEQGRHLYQKIEDNLRSETNPIIQIWTDASSKDFIFPWVWLHSKDVPSGQRVDLDHATFWGYRFVIEQIRYSSARFRAVNPLHGKPIKLAAGFHSFPFREHQRNEFRFWADRCPTNFNWHEIPQSDWMQFLSRCDSHIVYLYCHGHTELPFDPQNAELMRTMKRLAESVSADILEAINIEEQRKIRNSSFIQIEQAKLNLGDISRFKPATDTLNPLVFLNMCESAEMYPGMSNNFVDVFLENGACGVLGSEIPMLANYGHYFALRFFDLMFLPDARASESQSRSIGEILLQMRREFIDDGNPLAFAYTYLGDANERLSPSIYHRDA